MHTRAKITAVIILCALASIGCDRSASTSSEQRDASGGAGVKSELYEQPVRLATLEDRSVKESSGIVASRRNTDLFWTHNDSGDGPYLFAFDRAGSSKGRWRVEGAEAYDWEDIAAGPGAQPGASYLYVGDIGDNDAERSYITVYRVAEPAITSDVDSANASAKHETELAEAIRIKYPDGSHDAEAMMVHPITGDLYIVTKTFESAAGVYKLKAPFSANSVHTLERVGQISVPSLVGGLITGGDISQDGRRVVLCDYINAYEIILPENSKGSFDDIWKQQIITVELGKRRQGEAVCYRLDGKAILATSEGRPAPLIEVRQKNRRQ